MAQTGVTGFSYSAGFSYSLTLTLGWLLVGQESGLWGQWKSPDLPRPSCFVNFTFLKELSICRCLTPNVHHLFRSYQQVQVVLTPEGVKTHPELPPLFPALSQRSGKVIRFSIQ